MSEETPRYGKHRKRLTPLSPSKKKERGECRHSVTRKVAYAMAMPLDPECDYMFTGEEKQLSNQ